MEDFQATSLRCGKAFESGSYSIGFAMRDVAAAVGSSREHVGARDRPRARGWKGEGEGEQDRVATPTEVALGEQRVRSPSFLL